MGIRRTPRDDWALGQLRALGSLDVSDEALRSPKTTGARLVALGLAHAVPASESGYWRVLPLTQGARA